MSKVPLRIDKEDYLKNEGLGCLINELKKTSCVNYNYIAYFYWFLRKTKSTQKHTHPSTKESTKTMLKKNSGKGRPDCLANIK